jgi:hypothetical protein
MVGRRSSVVSIVAAGAAMAVGLSSSSAAPKPQTISLLEVDTSFVGIGGFSTTSNVPPAVGQGFVSTGLLYKWAGVKKGAPAGQVRVVCTVTSVKLSGQTGSVSTQCEVSFLLPGGVIQISGPLNLTAQTNTLPVVGGTGAYAGAEGVVGHRTIGGQNSNNSADVIRLTN